MKQPETFREFCKKQVARLGGTINFPDPTTAPAAVGELIATLEVRVSKGSRELAQTVINKCLESSKYCPTVADLIEIGTALREHRRTGPAYGFTGCLKCDHSGWKLFTRGGYDFAGPCSCRAG